MPTKVRPARTKKNRNNDGPLADEFQQSRSLRIVALVAILAIVGWVAAGLFAPGPRYSLASASEFPVDSAGFLKQLEPLVHSRLTRNNQIEIFPNGENFYEAEFATLRQAQHSITIEAYIFHKGVITKRLLGVLSERARAGVRVRVVLDSLGSLSMPKRYFKPLVQAGGRVEWYHPLRWNNWFASNNRTHREMTIVDGRTAFVGGAGYADWWRFASKRDPRWRDTMFRVQGDAVAFLQGVFVENWLEASGEILNGEDYFPLSAPDRGNTLVMVVASTPSSGGSTRSRILFQTMIAAARKSVYVTTPYFLPDRSMRQEMVSAMRRGVTVRIIVPGKHDDHWLTRSSGRGLFGDLLKAGAQIYEYEPSMIHAKIMVVDGAWVVVGSTNLDNRSFGINDEVNLAALDSGLAATLAQQFDQDASHAEHVTLDTWRNRPLYERLLEWAGWVFARQQ